MTPNLEVPTMQLSPKKKMEAIEKVASGAFHSLG